MAEIYNLEIYSIFKGIKVALQSYGINNKMYYHDKEIQFWINKFMNSKCSWQECCNSIASHVLNK